MQQIYRRTLMQKCDFNKVLVFSCFQKEKNGNIDQKWVHG